MKLLTKQQREQMLKNGRILAAHDYEDGTPQPEFRPVVKLFTPDANCTWLLSEIDPECEDIAFGLCDLGLGSPELGSVCISEIQSLRGRLGLPVERDRSFEADKTLSEYADDARLAQRITV
jgi:hypothetical protein